MIKIGIIDDHQLFVKSLGMMLDTFKDYKVVLEACTGKDLMAKIAVQKELPDIILLDVNMPQMNGLECAQWLTQHYPAVKLVALSSNDSDQIIIGMIKAGCCAYMLKDTHPNELEKALNEIAIKGYYNGDISNINFRRLLQSQEKNNALNLTEKEKTFLQHACSDMTYKHIALLMNVSERTVDSYRENLFAKFNVQSRVGLCLEAVRRELVQL
jgi:DNA-binding NarL/FixJ family response regulator